MATLGLSTPARQPFASLDGARLMGLTSLKNRQNALPVTLSTPVKRRMPTTFNDADSENIDPLASLSHKKSKTTDGNLIVKPGKTSQFVLTNAIRPSAATSRPILTPKRLETSRSTLTKPKAVQPSSAPAATGRSPKSKRIGILSRRRVSSSPFTRVDPPSFGSSNGLPFSIDAALSGSVSTYNPNNVQQIKKSTSRKSQQKKWFFDIHEDTPEQESSNLLQHSFTCNLDISDDEGRSKDGRGKENIPPLDYVVSANRSISRNDMMTDEPRTPLGDLEASQYYAEGCDESSAFIIPDEKAYEETSATSEVNVITSQADATAVTVPCQPSADVSLQSEDQWKDLMAQLECTKKSNAALALAAAAAAGGSKEAEIEIWESESANAEEESASKGITSNILQSIVPETYTCGAFGDENSAEPLLR